MHPYNLQSAYCLSIGLCCHYRLKLHQGGFDCFGPQMALASLVAISGPKKVSIFRAHPFQWPSKWILPHQNHYVPGHINIRYINNYTAGTNKAVFPSSRHMLYIHAYTESTGHSLLCNNPNRPSYKPSNHLLNLGILVSLLSVSSLNTLYCHHSNVIFMSVPQESSYSLVFPAC
jgi:hypothetical protein